MALKMYLWTADADRPEYGSEIVVVLAHTLGGARKLAREQGLPSGLKNAVETEMPEVSDEAIRDSYYE